MIYIVIVFGAIVGSFLNVCIFRMPLGISIIRPSSSCPYCRSRIRFYDNIPIVSFILLLGRCRRCGRKISLVYPFVEITAAIFAAVIFLKYGLTINALLIFSFVCALIVISFIDFKHYIIPDSISLSGIGIGFIATWLPSSPVSPLDSLIGIVLGGGGLLLVGIGYEKLTGKEGIGGGDIKLLAMMGSFLGYKSVLLIIFIGSITGALSGSLLLLLIKNRDRHSIIPFGPFLAFGALISVFFGDKIISYYMNLF